MRKLFLFITLLLSYLSNSTVNASSIINNIQKLNLSDGLSSGFVYDIVQDHNDLIWIATESGLNCYNGFDNKVYFSEFKNDNSLSNNQIQSLFFDNKEQQLWIGTNYGLNKYNYEKDSFTRFFYFKDSQKTKGADIIKIIPCDDNNLWICSYYNGLILFDKIKEEFKLIESDLFDKSLSIDALTIYNDGFGRIWMGTNSRGIYSFDIKDSLFTYHNFVDIDKSLISVRDFYIDKNKNIIAATSKGIYIKRNDSNEFFKYNLNQEIDMADLYSIKTINNKEIWIGSENGIYIIDGEFEKDCYYTKIDMKDNNSGLSFRSVRNLFQDRYNNIWISTYAGGVNYIPSSLPIFKNIKPTEFSGSVEKYNDKILSIKEDYNGNFYIGTDGYGIIKLDNNHEFIERIDFDKKKKNLNRNIIQTIYCDSSNVIWAGTYEAGLIRYDQNNKDLKYFDNINSKICGNDIRYIVNYKDDIIVCGKNGLSFFNKSGEIYKTYITGQKGLHSHDIRKILTLENGDLWLTTYNGGIVFFDRANDIFTTYTHNDSDSLSISDNMIEDAYLSDNGKVWITTKNGGISYCTTNDGKFYQTKIPHENHGFCSIVEDGNNYLWLCSVSYIARFNTITKQFDIYNNNQILSTGMYFASATYVSRDNSIYFGGANGILYFSPEKFITSTRPSLPPLFVDFKLFNKSVPISTGDNVTPLKTNILSTNTIDLKYNQSVFSISYISPNYGFTSELKYAYKLEGEDQDWNYVNNRNFAEYRNLKPGKYRFVVKVSNQDGIWNLKPSVLNINIHPPFWKTPIMYVIYCIISIFIIYCLFRFLTYRTSTYNKLKYARLKRDKNEELYQLKLQFFTNISHEFRTPVTLISNPIERLLNIEDDKEKRYLLSIMKRNSDRLLKLINQILDLRRLDNNGFNLNVESLEINSVIEDIFLSFKYEAEKRDIDYKMNNSFVQTKLLYFDKEIFNKVLYNIISNAFKYTPNYGEININIYDKNYNGEFYLAIDIVDTGIGISKDNIDKIFNRFYQCKDNERSNCGSGIGLHLVKELIRLHHGYIFVESKINEGSKFSLLFPMNIFSHKDIKLSSCESVSNIEKNSLNNQSYELINSDEIEKFEIEPVDNTGSRKKMLIVDDEADILNYLSLLFSNKFEVHTAGNGVEAIDFLKDSSVDIIISDVMMPEMDGISFCSKIKNDMAYCHIPIILLTAKGSVEANINGLEIGADDYITKPFNSDILTAKVFALIRYSETLKNKYKERIASIETEAVNAPEKEISERKRNLNDFFIDKAIEIVINDLDNEELNGELLAARLNMSRVHLHRKLKSILNISTSEFIRNIRLKEASKMLKNGEMNISEVSYATGFSSPSYFSGCFTKYFGISPKEYQNRV